MADRNEVLANFQVSRSEIGRIYRALIRINPTAGFEQRRGHSDMSGHSGSKGLGPHGNIERSHAVIH